jgi:hypothetical protein
MNQITEPTSSSVSIPTIYHSSINMASAIPRTPLRHVISSVVSSTPVQMIESKQVLAGLDASTPLSTTGTHPSMSLLSSTHSEPAPMQTVHTVASSVLLTQSMPTTSVRCVTNQSSRHHRTVRNTRRQASAAVNNNTDPMSEEKRERNRRAQQAFRSRRQRQIDYLHEKVNIQAIEINRLREERRRTLMQYMELEAFLCNVLCFFNVSAVHQNTATPFADQLHGATTWSSTVAPMLPACVPGPFAHADLTMHMNAPMNSNSVNTITNPATLFSSSTYHPVYLPGAAYNVPSTSLSVAETAFTGATTATHTYSNIQRDKLVPQSTASTINMPDTLMVTPPPSQTSYSCPSTSMSSATVQQLSQ